MPENNLIRIGTRESELATWQATEVQKLLSLHGHNSELIFIKSEGDIDLTTPLYEMGVEGIFTKSLDLALLHNKIDIAVHSMKDVPTTFARGIAQAAVLSRGNYRDVLILPASELTNETQSDLNQHIRKSQAVIATSSMRRRAQWLHRYPADTMENLRGNVNTRLAKLESSNWNGAIFAAAGLERINKLPKNAITLDWMLPAPAQGAVLVVARENDNEILAACAPFNDADSALCTSIEKQFLKTLQGGCTTPVGILAQIEGNMVVAAGCIHSADGKQKAEVQRKVALGECENLGEMMAKEMLANGGAEILKEFEDARANKNTEH